MTLADNWRSSSQAAGPWKPDPAVITPTLTWHLTQSVWVFIHWVLTTYPRKPISFVFPFYRWETKGTEYKASKQRSQDSKAGSLAPEPALFSTLFSSFLARQLTRQSAGRETDWPLFIQRASLWGSSSLRPGRFMKWVSLFYSHTSYQISFPSPSEEKHT